MLITYKHWDDTFRQTDPAKWSNYYLLLRKRVEGTDGSYFSNSAGFYGKSEAEVRQNLAKWFEDNKGYTIELFRAAEATIVKAPCAFDACTISEHIAHL